MQRLSVLLFVISIGVLISCSRPPILAKGPIALSRNPITVRFSDSLRLSSPTWEFVFRFDNPDESNLAHGIRAVLLTSENERDSLHSLVFDRRGEAMVAIIGTTSKRSAAVYAAVELTSDNSVTVANIRGGAF